MLALSSGFGSATGRTNHIRRVYNWVPSNEKKFVLYVHSAYIFFRAARPPSAFGRPGTASRGRGMPGKH